MDEIRLLYVTLGVIDTGGSARSFPRTARLLDSGRSKIAKKVGEEAVEVALAAEGGRHNEAVQESADLLYNLTVLWRHMGITPDEVLGEMTRRRKLLGIAEKLPKQKASGKRRAPKHINAKGRTARLMDDLAYSSSEPA
jgi:phosphoribosyl-ATP pyrophosphohydrolase